MMKLIKKNLIRNAYGQLKQSWGLIFEKNVFELLVPSPKLKFLLVLKKMLI